LATFLGRGSDACALVCFYPALGALVSRTTPPKPIAATPTVVLSPTLHFPTTVAPTDDDVERWHAAYVAASRRAPRALQAPR
jgi:hypothetical protein